MPRKDALIKQAAVLVAGVLLVGLIIYKHYYSGSILKDYYTIGVILNNIELTSKDMEVIQFIIRKKVELINQQGGIDGKELRIKYLNDKGSSVVAKQVVQETIDDRHMIGYVGCWSSTRTKAISEVIGPARMPLIGGYSLTTLFDDYPTMFTAEQGIKDVAVRFDLLLRTGFKRLAFVGKTDDLYSIALLDRMYHLEKSDPTVKVVLEKWFPAEHEFKAEEINSIAQTLTNNDSDFLLLSFESGISTSIVNQLRKKGVNIPVFTALGDLGLIVSQSEENLAGELYDLNVVGIPGTFNLRLQELIPTVKNNLSSGQTLELQMSFGARIADSIGIIAEAAKATEGAPGESIRERINKGLQRYLTGGKIYRGWFEDWYFTSDKAIAGDVLLAWKPPSLSRPILAPTQYMRVNDTLQQVPVFFTHMDLIEINRVSDTDGSFYATFFLEITSTSKVSVEQIDFTNAARSETNHKYLLDIKPISVKTLNARPALYNYMFKVSGKFLFEPDLKKYPFDKQKFSINFQPSSAIKPFLVQPSIASLNDSVFDAKGWHYSDQFVGYDHDIISYVNTFTDKQQTLPFYKFSYTYVLTRARVDFFLKVLTPLLVILVVTYFSVFIPLHRFETLEAIQVTSLLASIALYFSAYKPEMENATISDKIFIFTYVMITSLIGTSILRFVKRKKYNTESKIAKVYQHYIFPIIILAFTLLIVS